MPTLVRAPRNNSLLLKNSEIQNRAFQLIHNSIGTRRQYFMSELGYSNRTYLLLSNKYKGGVNGFAFVQLPENKGMVELTLIGTRQGLGYGKQIMNAIYNNAKKEGYKGVTAKNVVLSAEGFYRKMGYKYNGRHSYSYSRQRTPSPNRKRKKNNSPRQSPNRKRNNSPRKSPNRKNGL